MVWNAEKDEMLCREVILVEPYSKKPSTRERGQAWTMIAEVLNNVEQPIFNVTQRGVRERFALLEKRCKDRTREEVLASGISPEETPLDSILEEIIEKTKEFEAIFQDQKGKDKEKNEEEKKKEEDVRLEAMETFAQTRKRKAEDDITPKRSTKRSGSETIAYLRERAEQDHVTKLEELEIKRKDQQALETQ